MQDERSSESGHEKLPEVPSAPRLPDAPVIRADLPARPTESQSEGLKQYRNMGIAYTIPMALLAPIVVLLVGGWWLDQRFHKSPVFTLAGALVGTVVGFINMFRLASRLND